MASEQLVKTQRLSISLYQFKEYSTLIFGLSWAAATWTSS